MSVQAISWAMEQSGPAAGAKFVLVILCNYASAEGLCCPGIERLAADSNLDERTVRRHLMWLEANNLIQRDRRYKNGHRTSDQFWLMLPGTMPCEEQVSQDNLPTMTEKLTGHHAQSLPGKNDPTSKRNRQIEEPSELITKRARAREVPRREEETTKKKCKTSLPENFPSGKEHDWARAHWEARKRPDLDPIDQGESFRDHHLKNGSKFLDWGAAWREWTRRAVSYSRAPNGASAGSGGAAKGGSGIPHREFSEEDKAKMAVWRERMRVEKNWG